MNRPIAVLLLLFSMVVKSDVTGAGDAAVFAQLVTMTETLVKQVETLEDGLNVAKKIENLEQAKSIRSLSSAGKNLMESMDNLNEAKDGIDGIQDDPFGMKSVEQEITDLEQKIASAKSEPNGELKARKYSRILKDLKNVRLLGQVVADNKTKISEGMNDSDAVKSTSESSAVLADVLVQEHEKKLREESSNATVMEGIFSKGKYDDLGNIEDFRYE